jgi:regulator of protease activity HflC (stomatin/prohibitin superfamily)
MQIKSIYSSTIIILPSNQKKPKTKTMFLEAIGAIAFVGFLLMVSGIIQVSQGERVVIENFGRFSRVLSPGIHVTIPIIDQYKWVHWKCTSPDEKSPRLDGYRIPITQRIFDPPAFKCTTTNSINVKIDLVIYYEISDVHKSVYSIDNLYEALQQKIITVTQECISSMKLESIASDKKKLADALGKLVHTEAIPWGLNITQINIQSIEIPVTVTRAIEKMVSAEYEAIAQKKVLEAERETIMYKEKTETEVQNAKVERDLASEMAKIRIKKEWELVEIEKKKNLIDSEREWLLMVKEMEVGDNYLSARVQQDTLASIGSTQKIIVIPYEFTKSAVLHVGPNKQNNEFVSM